MSKLLALLAASLLMLGAAAAAVQIYEGGWSDGTKLEWTCPTGTSGKFPFRFTQIDGKNYQGVVSCGESV